MKKRVSNQVYGLIVGITASVAAGTTVAADQTSKHLTDSVVVKRAVAANINSQSGNAEGFRWSRDDTTSSEAQVATVRGVNTQSVRWHLLTTAPEQGQQSASASSADTYAVKGFRWGVKNEVEQQGFRWGVKGVAIQQGFRWGVKNAATQQGFRWGVKSAAEQQGFRWGVKSAAEQQGFRWGVKNASTQQGFRWGVK